jgi:FMN phosphatase YigB (HAD superfamily)
MSKKPIIAIDIDDVLAKGTESLRLLVNQRLGVNLTEEDYRIPKDMYWGYYEHIWEQHGIADKVDFAGLNKEMEIDQSHVPAFEESRGILTRLSKKYEFVIVTARDPAWARATVVWVNTNYPDVFSAVYFAGHKGGKSKGEICVEIGADWLIDDSIPHAHTALEQGVRVILFGDYGWQMKQEIHPDIIRCLNWHEVGRTLDGQS